MDKKEYPEKLYAHFLEGNYCPSFVTPFPNEKVKIEFIEYIRADSLGGRVLTCVYCGMEYPQDTPAWGNDVLTEHIKICKKHPMRKAEEEIKRLKTELRADKGEEVDGDLLYGLLQDLRFEWEQMDITEYLNLGMDFDIWLSKKLASKFKVFVLRKDGK